MLISTVIACIEGKELIPITDLAIRKTHYTDSVNINSLNSKVYYALTSLDERYNQSEQSKIIEVTKPQALPPTMPVLTKATAEIGKNIIEWVSGGEPHLAGFIVARTDEDGKSEQKVQRIENPAATKYEDSDIESGKSYIYQVMAYAANQVYSLLSGPMKIKTLVKEDEKDAIKFDLVIVPEGIAIKWDIPYKDIISVTLYKLDATNTKFLYREGLPVSGEFVDADILQGKENEYMLVIKAKAHKPISIKKKIHI